MSFSPCVRELARAQQLATYKISTVRELRRFRVRLETHVERARRRVSIMTDAA